MTTANEYVYPIVTPLESRIKAEGGTKRELFAAYALQGLLSTGYAPSMIDDFARDAVRAADALIAVLNKPRKSDNDRI